MVSAKEKNITSETRHLILNGLTIINGTIDQNNRIKSTRLDFFRDRKCLEQKFSGVKNACPPIEICATASPIDSFQCPVYATPSTRLDFPLFHLVLSEQVDPMTYLVFENGTEIFIEKTVAEIISSIYFVDHEEMEDMAFANVIREEEQANVSMKSDVLPLREASPVSQLSQSTERTNPPSVKDIRRDEPMLGF